MKYSPSFSILLFLASILLFSSEQSVVAQGSLGPGFRQPQIFDTIRRQEHRQRYRPSIKATGSRTFASGDSVRFEYRVRQGFVSKIEIRSGLKVIKTVYPTPSPSGRGSFTLTSSDFLRAGKKGSKFKFKLWAWQGQPAWQSVHGESVSYTLVP